MYWSFIRRTMLCIWCISLIIGLLPNIISAQYETEPNNNIGDAGIQVLNDDCWGTVDEYYDLNDIWYLEANSSGTINITPFPVGEGDVEVVIYSNSNTYGFGNHIITITPENPPEWITLSADLYYLIQVTNWFNTPTCEYMLNITLMDDIPIFSNSTVDEYFIEDEFWVDIHTGNESASVTDLFGVSFILNYTNTDYLDVVIPEETNSIGGSFMGPDSVFVSKVDESAGQVSIGISRKYPANGISGEGVVVRVKFTSRENTPNQTRCDFTITDIIANDHDGNAIELTPQAHSVTINTSIAVWPGDTNNDGIVNQEDVLPLGLHWHSAGTARENATNAWEAQRTTPWEPEATTYADANGSGQVDQADLLPIGLNWSKEQTEPMAKSLAKNSIENEGPVTHYFDTGSGLTAGEPDTVSVMVNNINTLFGNSFVVSTNDNSDLEFLDVLNGDVLGGDIILYNHIDNENGKVCVGMTRKAGQGGVNQNGVLCQLIVRINASTENIQLNFTNVTAVDPTGEHLAVHAQNAVFNCTAVHEKTLETARIETFQLHQNYPNPFNPSTTIAYDLPRQSQVRLQIFNIEGKLIKTLVSGIQPAGVHSVVWDGTDNTNVHVSNGMYLCRLISDEQSSQRKIIYMK